MTKLTKAQVAHIAKLCRLTLTPEEEERYAKELSKILDCIDILKEVDTEGVEPTEQVTGLSNALRQDEIRGLGVEPEDLLKTSPLPIIERQIQTPSAHG